MKNKKTLIIQEVMKHYRVPFYQRLYKLVKESGYDLQVSYSSPQEKDLKKNDNADLPIEYSKKINLVS